MVVYSIVVFWAFPAWGKAWGMLISLIVSYAWSFGLYLAVKRWVT